MKVKPSAIEGLAEIELDVLTDDRGSFREAYQAEKLAELGLPAMDIVQQNISVSKYGVIRGIHAEPWDKYIHAAAGTGFAAIVDFRRGSKTFGQVATFELSADNALFVPNGLGNSFAATSDELTYSYLVTEHWRPGTAYPAVDLFDPDLAIDWPIPEKDRVVSDKDRQNPGFKEAFSDAL